MVKSDGSNASIGNSLLEDKLNKIDALAEKLSKIDIALVLDLRNQ